MAFSLPPLPYSADALAGQGMCQETLELHHGKHHNAYVTALNGLVESKNLGGKSLEDIVAEAGKQGADGLPVSWTLDGKATFTRQTRGYYSPAACRVAVVHRQSYDAGVSGPTEYVGAQVEGTGPVEALCGQARDLARQAERNAG